MHLLTPIDSHGIPKPLSLSSQFRIFKTLIDKAVVPKDSLESKLFYIFENVARRRFPHMPPREWILKGFELAHPALAILGLPTDLTPKEVGRIASEIIDALNADMVGAKCLVQISDFPADERARLCSFWDDRCDYSQGELQHNFRLLLQREPLMLLSKKYERARLTTLLPSDLECANILITLKNIVTRSPGALFVKLLDENTPEFVDCFVDYFYIILMHRPKEVMAAFRDKELFYALLILKLIGWMAQLCQNLLRTMLVLHTYVVSHKDLSEVFFELNGMKLTRTFDLAAYSRRLRNQILDPHYPNIFQAFLKAAKFWSDGKLPFVGAAQTYLTVVCTRRENRLRHVQINGPHSQEFIALETHTIQLHAAIENIRGLDPVTFDLGVIQRYEGAFNDLTYDFVKVDSSQRTMLNAVVVPLVLLLGPAKEKLLEKTLSISPHGAAKDRSSQRFIEFVQVLFKLLNKMRNLSLNSSRLDDQEELERGEEFVRQLTEYLFQIRNREVNPISLFLNTVGKGRAVPSEMRETNEPRDRREARRGSLDAELGQAAGSSFMAAFQNVILMLESQNFTNIIFEMFEMRRRRFNKQRMGLLYQKVLGIVERILQSQTPPRCLSEGPVQETAVDFDNIKLRQSTTPNHYLLLPKGKPHGQVSTPLIEAYLALCQLHKNESAKDRRVYSSGIPLKKKGIVQEGQMWTDFRLEDPDAEERRVEDKEFPFLRAPKEYFKRRERSNLRRAEWMYLLAMVVNFIVLTLVIRKTGEEAFYRLMDATQIDQLFAIRSTLAPAVFYMLLLKTKWFE